MTEPLAPYTIAKHVVLNKGQFHLGYVTPYVSPRVSKLFEAKEKQIFKEIWGEMTPEERQALMDAITVNYPTRSAPSQNSDPPQPSPPQSSTIH